MKIFNKTRLLGFLLAAVLLLSAPVAARAEYNYEGLTTPNIIVIDSNDLSAANPIYERSADTQLYPASTTKILTCILALESGDIDRQITVGEEIKGLYELKNGYTENSSLMGLVVGETVTMRDLLHGLMLASGNEAADAIAVAVGGTIENFVSMMNAKAAELGMTGSHFMNPNGVNHDNHYSTARDMAKLTAYAMQNPQFNAICSTPVYMVPPSNMRSTELKLINSNFLLTAEDSPEYSSYPYQYCIGVKTGRTTKAGSCLIAAAEKDGARAIVCLFGDTMDDNMSRFTNAKAIFEDLFETAYGTVSGSELNLQSSFSCTIERGRPEDLDENGQLTLTVDPSNLTVRALATELQNLKANAGAITADVVWTDSLNAPVRQGQMLGTVTYSYNGKPIFSTELTAPHDVLEVAVISSGLDPSSDIAPTAGLLTTPSEPAEKEKDGPNAFLIILLAVLGVAVVFGILMVVLAAIKRQRRRKLREQRRQQARQQRTSAPSNGQRSTAQTRAGHVPPRASSSNSRSSAPQTRSAAPQQRSRSSAPSRTAGPADRRPDGRSGSGSSVRSGSTQVRRPNDQQRRRPQ